MERLTFVKCPKRWKTGQHPTKYTSHRTFQEVVARLAAYEDTGLEPEEVEIMRETKADAQFMLTELCRLCDYDRLEELAKADKDGRLVVLPCKVGDTVWYIGGIHNTLVKPARVMEFVVADNGVIDLCVETDNCICYQDSFNSFFLTREEAEKALEGQK